jgi:hypothetical protein
MFYMKKRSKILTLGLGGFVDELITEVGFNKTQIHNRINEELANRGKDPITWNTVSSYLDAWAEEREENVRNRMALINVENVKPDAEWGIEISKSIASKYDDSVARSLIAATSVETGMINAIQFYSAVVAAGLASILQDPSKVSLQDALKASDALERISGKGGAKTILSQAIQINTNAKDISVDLLEDDDIILH